MEFLFESKRIFLGYKIQMSILGLLIPLILVSIVYQIRFTLKDFTYKMAMILAFGSIAVIPIIIVYLQFTPALEINSCVKHANRFITIKTKEGQSISTTLVYKISSLAEGRYEMKGNDGALLKVAYNRVDLDRRYKITKNCGGIQ
ncbi:MAG: hypothetical protein VX583_07355 [Bdellovibrionota bacterium]